MARLSKAQVAALAATLAQENDDDLGVLYAEFDDVQLRLQALAVKRDMTVRQIKDNAEKLASEISKDYGRLIDAEDIRLRTLQQRIDALKGDDEPETEKPKKTPPKKMVGGERDAPDKLHNNPPGSVDDPDAEDEVLQPPV